MTPARRKLRAQAAANARWARASDRAQGTQAARDAWAEKFANQVDPEGRLDPVERERRAASAMRSHMQSLAFKRHAG